MTATLILLVDDDETVRRLTRTLLEQADFAVVEASDGVEALNAFHQNAGKINLLLTDIVMPRMKGTELVKQIRAEDGRLPVLFMSAYCDSMDPSLHGIDCIAKPFAKEELISKIREAVGFQNGA